MIPHRYAACATAALLTIAAAADGCSQSATRQNSLSQNTGEAGVPRRSRNLRIIRIRQAILWHHPGIREETHRGHHPSSAAPQQNRRSGPRAVRLRRPEKGNNHHVSPHHACVDLPHSDGRIPVRLQPRSGQNDARRTTTARAKHRSGLSLHA